MQNCMVVLSLAAEEHLPSDYLPVLFNAMDTELSRILALLSLSMAAEV